MRIGIWIRFWSLILVKISTKSFIPQMISHMITCLIALISLLNCVWFKKMCVFSHNIYALSLTSMFQWFTNVPILLWQSLNSFFTFHWIQIFYSIQYISCSIAVTFHSLGNSTNQNKLTARPGLYNWTYIFSICRWPGIYFSYIPDISNQVN